MTTYNWSGAENISKYTSSGKSWSGKTAARLEAVVSKANDTHATVKLTGAVHTVKPYTFGNRGVRVTVGHSGGNGTSAGKVYKDAVLDNANWVGAVTSTWTFARKVEPYKVTVYVKYAGREVDGKDAAKNSGALTKTVTIPALPTYKPYAPTKVVNARNSNTQNTVTWQRNNTDMRPYKNQRVERAVDGGLWKQIAVVGYAATSYVDKTTSANHRYRYRVRAYNSAGFSLYNLSGITYNTPAAPTEMVASRSTAEQVKLTIENPAKTATSCEIQRRPVGSDTSAWATIKTIACTEASPVKTVYDKPGDGSFYYRARNKRGSLASAWCFRSNAVGVASPPSKPTLVAPAASKAFPVRSEGEELDIVFEWRHNPTDGAEQTAAELQWSYDGGATWNSQVLQGSAQSYSMLQAAATEGTEMVWRVRTKAVDADWSPWSDRRNLSFVWQPEVSFHGPASENGGVPVLTSMPCEVLFSHEENPEYAGLHEMVGATLAVRKIVDGWTEVGVEDSEAESDTDVGGDAVDESEDIAENTGVYELGDVLWSCEIDPEADLADEYGDGNVFRKLIEVGDFVFENNTHYLLEVTTRSSTTSEAQASLEIYIDFPVPAPATADIDFDEETGVATVTVMLLEDEGGLLETAESASLYRIVDGREKCLGSGMANGQGVSDKYAPVNVPMVYRVVAVSKDGAPSITDIPVKLSTPWFYMYFGEDGVAKARWGVQETKSMKRPSKTRIHYAGRRDAVSYDSAHQSQSRTVSCLVEEREEALAFERLMDSGGRAVYKALDGDVLFCDVEASVSPAYSAGYFGAVSATVEKIAHSGGEL